MKIRGNTVGTTIKPEKTVVKCKTLVEEEKAIARANIGASSTIIVTIGDNNKASHTSREIYEHVQNGDLVMLDTGYDMFSNLTTVDPGAAYFAYVDILDEAGGLLGSHKIDYEGNAQYNFSQFRDSLEFENYIYEQLGPIDSALDSILKIQNELIGGDGI